MRENLFKYLKENEITDVAYDSGKVSAPKTGFPVRPQNKDRLVYNSIVNALYDLHVALTAFDGKESYYITDSPLLKEAIENGYMIKVSNTTVVDEWQKIKPTMTFDEIGTFFDFVLSEMPADLKNRLIHMNRKVLHMLYEKFMASRRAKYPDYFRFKDFVETSWCDPFEDHFTEMPSPDMIAEMYGVFNAYREQLQNEEADKKCAEEKNEAAGKAAKTEICTKWMRTNVGSL